MDIEEEDARNFITVSPKMMEKSDILTKTANIIKQSFMLRYSSIATPSVCRISFKNKVENTSSSYAIFFLLLF